MGRFQLLPANPYYGQGVNSLILLHILIPDMY